MAAGKAFAFLWQHGKAGHKDKELQNDLNTIIKGTYNDEVTGHRKKPTRSTSALGFVYTQKAAVNFQPPPPVFSEAKFFSFWNQMDMMDAATQFLEVLLKRLNELDRETLEGEEFSRRGVPRRSWAFGLVYHSKEQSMDVLPGSPAKERAFRLPPPKEQSFNIETNMKFTVLNTILVLALYHNMDLEKESTMRLLEMMRHNAGNRLNSTWHQTVLFILSLNKQGQNQNISTLVGHCAACMSSHISAVNNNIIASGWLYLWLQERALDGQCSAVMRGLFRCADLIEKDPSTVVTPAHELQILSLLFMIRALFSLTLPDEVILSQLSGVIKGFMCWTNPVGHHAIETFKAIALEQRAPGHALRRRFMLSDPRFLHKKMGGKIDPKFRCRTYAVLNFTCSDAKPFRSLLRCNNTNQDTLEDVVDAKLLLSLLMLDEKLTDENAEAALQKGIHTWLLQLPASMVSILYDAALEVMEEASQAKQEKEAQEIRRRGVLEIWQDLEEAKMLGKLPGLVPAKELEVEFVAKR